MNINVEVPYNIEAEANILTLIMMYKEAQTLIPELSEDYFFNPYNKIIFKVIRNLFDSGTEIDPLVVLNEIHTSHKDIEPYLMEISGAFVSPTTLNYYVQKLKEYKTLRNIYFTGKNILKLLNETDSTEAKLNKAQDMLMALLNVDGTTKDKIYTASQLASIESKAIDERMRLKGKLPGIDTGFNSLNRITGGFRGGQLVIVGGRPGMGKTAFMTTMAVRMASSQIPVLYLSIEMSVQEMADRILSQLVTFENNKIRAGTINEQEVIEITKGLSKMSSLPLYLAVDTTDVAEVRNMVVTAKANYDIKAVFLDYIQLMDLGLGSSYENRQNEMAKISRALKHLAMQTNTTIIVGSQLNRMVEGRKDKKPTLADLRESGAIEQDSDIVLLLYRKGYYDEDGKTDNTAEVCVAKHRNGPTGVITMAFLPEHILYADIWKGDAGNV